MDQRERSRPSRLSDPLEVDCATCGAEVGERCRAADPADAAPEIPHVLRRTAARGSALMGGGTALERLMRERGETT